MSTPKLNINLDNELLAKLKDVPDEDLWDALIQAGIQQETEALIQSLEEA